MPKSVLFPAAILLALVAFGFCSCNSGSRPAATPGQQKAGTPAPTGSLCTVHFCRNYLGMASENPISCNVNGYNGADLTLTGRLVSLDDQWLVLSRGQNLQSWIPRNVILHMTVDRK